MTRGYLRFPHLAGDLLTFVAEDDVWLAPLGRRQGVADQHRPRPRESTPVVARRAAGGLDEHGRRCPGGARRRPRRRQPATPHPLRGRHHRRARLDRRRPGAGRVARRREEPQQPRRLRRRARRRARRSGCPTATSATSPSLPAERCSPPRRAPSRWRGGSATAAARRRSCGSTGAGTASSSACSPRSGLRWSRRCGSTVAPRSGSCPTGKARVSCGPRHCRPTGCPELADLRRLTDTEFYVRHATSDGHRVVFQSGGDIWLWDGDDAAPIDIDLGGERRATMPRPIDASHQLGAISPAVDGRASAVEVRGTVSWLTHRDGPVRVPGVGVDGAAAASGGGHAWPATSPGSPTPTATTPSRCGAPPTRPPERSPPGQLGRVLELVAAPDGSLLAGASHDGRLWVVPWPRGELREIDRTDNGDITGLAFAPDSRWLAWSHPGPQPLAQIRVAEVADPAATPIDVTPLRFADTEPAFSTDGKYLAFLSTRSFDPIYDAYVFDLSFPNGCRPQLVTLSATDSVSVRSGRRRAGAGPGQGRTARRVRRCRRAGRCGRDRPAGRSLPRARRSLQLVARRRRWLRVAARPDRRSARRRPRSPRRGPAAPRPGALRPDVAAHRDAPRRRRPVRPDRRRSAAGRRRQARDAGRPRRPQGGPRGGGEVGRHRHRRPRTPARHRHARRRVAADVRRGRAADARPLLPCGHERRRLGRRPRPLSAAGRAPRLDGRLHRPALGGPGGARARRTPTSGRVRRRTPAARGCSAPTSSPTVRVCGASSGSCPASPPTPAPARR